MNSLSIVPDDSSLEEVKKLLLRSVTENPDFGVESELAVCKSAYCRVHGIINRETGEIIPLNCKSWRCPVHRGSWLHRWQVIVEREARYNPIDKLITLTCASSCTPEQMNLARKYLFEDLRYGYGKFEYVSVLEFTTKSRLPHLHLLARGVFVPQKILSLLWANATQASGIKRSPIVYIEAPRSQKAASLYALSYALNGNAKNQDIPVTWRGRKISYSHGFFQAYKPKEHWRNYIEEHFAASSVGTWELIPTSISAIKDKTFSE